MLKNNKQRSIGQILSLIKNPYYTLSEEELEILEEHRNKSGKSKAPKTVKAQKNRVQKHDTEQDMEISDEPRR